MFIVEIIASLHSQSTSILADATNFFGDSLNYSSTLLGIASVWSSRLAYIKGIFMAVFGIFVIGNGILTMMYNHKHIS